eukprot:scaffold1504_cov417-Prasinococcus_capsulatus_cf.AAC.68
MTAPSSTRDARHSSPATERYRAPGRAAPGPQGPAPGARPACGSGAQIQAHSCPTALLGGREGEAALPWAPTSRLGLRLAGTAYPLLPVGSSPPPRLDCTCTKGRARQGKGVHGRLRLPPQRRGSRRGPAHVLSHHADPRMALLPNARCFGPEPPLPPQVEGRALYRWGRGEGSTRRRGISKCSQKDR